MATTTETPAATAGTDTTSAAGGESEGNFLFTSESVNEGHPGTS